ncbi:MAG: glycosyltransferase, partial [Candidatus Binatia bacterium]
MKPAAPVAAVPTKPNTILFLDVDGAPFLSFEMLSLQRAGAAVAFAGSRAIPKALKSGEFESLAPGELVLSWLGLRTLSALGRYSLTRPIRLFGALATAFRAYAREPAYLAKLAATLLWTLAVARWAETHGVEHLHANWAHLPATGAWFASRLTGLPFSFSGHAGRDLYRTTALLPEKVRDARFVTVCNRAAAEQLRRLCGADAAAKVRVCHHGIDLRRFRPGPALARDFALSVGNLDPAKGFDVMIRAMAILRRKWPRLRYRIVGEGAERARLEALAAELRLDDCVTLEGALHGDRLVDAYRQAAVFVAPSRLLDNGGRDGLPNVLLEAMATGIPAVGSNV